MSSMPNDLRNPLLRANSLADLCSWRGVDFVRCAYVTILGRQPDRAGEAFYLGRVRSGIAKLTVISQLRRSAEGRRHDPGMAGLDKALRKHRNALRPFVGVLVRMLTGRPGDSYRERQMRVLTDLAASLQAVEEQQSAGSAGLESVRREVGDLRASLVSIEAMVSSRIANLESHSGVLADTQRALVATSETLSAELVAASSRIEEVRSNVLGLRGLLLKAVPRVFG